MRVSICPYVGLRPFDREDSLLYFGRNAQVEALLALLGESRFLSVVGSSGCGKSSLVRAGLIPSLEAGFLVQDRDIWRIAAMKPGESPLRHLAFTWSRILGNVVANDIEALDVEDIADCIFNEGPEALIDSLAAAEQIADSNVLLLVDQFEELFRFGLDSKDSLARGQAEAFVAALLRLAGQRRFPVYICITMRSDFLGDCDAFVGLPETINKGQFLVPRLTRNQRREAIEGPAYLAGAEVAPRLIDRLLNENIDTRDDLPIFQHLLMRVWEDWVASGNSGPIDLQHYEHVHTIHDALHDHAEQALAELTPEDEQVARRLFQTITEVDAANRRTRRPARLSEICAIADTPVERVMAVIQQFQCDGRYFLVLSSPNPNDDPLVDISHESLIRQWETLEKWVDEEAESKERLNELAEAANRYFVENPTIGLFRDPQLQVALDWEARAKPTVSWANRYDVNFALAMRFLRESEQEQLDSKRQQSEDEKRRYLEQAKSKVRRRVTVLMAIAIVCMGAGIVFAINQYQKARISTALVAEQAQIADDQKQIAEKLAIGLQQSLYSVVLERERANEQSRIANERLQLLNQSKDIRQTFVETPQKGYGLIPDGAKPLRSQSNLTFEACVERRPYRAKNGSPTYLFKTMPKFLLGNDDINSIALVTYLMNHSSFLNPFITTGPDTNFTAKYDGIGCLTTVSVLIEYTDATKAPDMFHYNMCKLLNWPTPIECQ